MNDINLIHAKQKFELEEKAIKEKEAIDRSKREVTEKVACLVGRAQAFGYIGKLANVGELASLKEIKDNKLYKEAGIDTWAGFCEHIGIKTRTVDEHLDDLNKFGIEFMESTQKLGLTRQDLRRLRALPEDSRVEVVNQTIELENPTKEQIHALVDAIEDQAGEIATLKAEKQKQTQAIEKKNSAILRGQQQCVELEDKLRKQAASMENSIIRTDEAQAIELLSEIKGQFNSCLLMAERIDLDQSSAGVKAALVALLEYMNRMLKQTFCAIYQAHPEIDAQDVLDVPGFKNPWDNIAISPEADRKAVESINKRQAAR